MRLSSNMPRTKTIKQTIKHIENRSKAEPPPGHACPDVLLQPYRTRREFRIDVVARQSRNPAFDPGGGRPRPRP